jgi:ADP-ribose pyrophosphatase
MMRVIGVVKQARSITMAIIKWREISRKELFSKYGRKIEEVVFEMPDGNKSDFVIKNEGPAACVLALTDDDLVIVTRQFRPGVQEILVELPGGFVDEDDANPEAAIAREIYEETGYRGEFKKVVVAYDDAYSTMRRHCFVATGCKKVGPGKLDKNEFINVELLSLPKFRGLLRSGKMTDVEVGYLGLDYLGLL